MGETASAMDRVNSTNPRFRRSLATGCAYHRRIADVVGESPAMVGDWASILLTTAAEVSENQRAPPATASAGSPAPSIGPGIAVIPIRARVRCLTGKPVIKRHSVTRSRHRDPFRGRGRVRRPPRTNSSTERSTCSRGTPQGQCLSKRDRFVDLRLCGPRMARQHFVLRCEP
jgi:hypothetical protein